MKPIERIDEVDQLEKGRHYLVPHLIVESDTLFARGFNPRDAIPALLPAHSDPELQAEEAHYHYDRRFIIPSKLIQIPSNKVINIEETTKDGKLLPVPHRIEWLRAQCHNPSLPSLRFGHREQVALEAGILAADPALKDSSLIDGHICPHRGVSVKGCPAVSDVVKCPGHGLRFDAGTGRRVVR